MSDQIDVPNEIDGPNQIDGPNEIDVPKKRNVFSRLYHGETNFNIVGRWKLWFAISGLLMVVSVVSVGVKGLNLGIDFTGGTVWEVPAGDADPGEVGTVMAALGYRDVQVQELTQATGGGERTFRVEAEASASPDAETTAALDEADAALGRLINDVPDDLRGRYRTVQENLRSVEGPFEESVPAELTALQEQIDQIASEAADSDDAEAAYRAGLDELPAQVTTLETLEQIERERLGNAVSEGLAELTGSEVDQVTVDRIGPSWGKTLTEKARTALLVFMAGIMLYITFRFEFRMALATVAALVHDLVITVGVYSVFAFPVTPATVIALLTILGFSIYDGIVVFDRVDENKALLGRNAKMTYSEMANLSLNQVLMRSLNTSITALLPILSILVVGSWILGEVTLQEFGLALFVGVMLGAYSSLYIATPLLALLKEREPKYRELRERIALQRGTAGSGEGEDRVLVSQSAASGGITVEPKPRKQKRRT